ncbi:MAG TPA: hypothetical protein VEX60_02825 [Pyrinomonadaceae bacterium]|nr:hypothetical protein [Pyrinomonadaceae bacterium]
MFEKLSNWRRAIAIYGFTLALLIAPASIFATQKANSPAQTGSPASEKKTTPAVEPTAQKDWSVKMSKNAPHTFTVKAKEVKITEITGELSRLLKVPVILTPVVEQQRVSLDFGGLNLEATIRMLAPQSYVDYVAGGNDAAQPKPLAIYLQGFNERPPSATATVKGTSQTILIEGDTEEGTDSEAQKKKEKEDPLRVTFANNQLSVRAHKQPLSVVLFRIADEVGVPFEMPYESPEIIDIEFDNYSLEQALRSLSPGVRFYYRMDLQTFQTQPLRLALVAPSAAKS